MKPSTVVCLWCCYSPYSRLSACNNSMQLFIRVAAITLSIPGACCAVISVLRLDCTAVIDLQSSDCVDVCVAQIAMVV